MSNEQPLPIRFEAARALDQILNNDSAIELIKQGLNTVIKSYLTLMDEFHDEEICDAFENIMIIFSDEIKPYAVDICSFL